MHALYLHGFASSPHSSKARFFADRLAAAGVTLACPDLNDPDFSTLTISRMIQQAETALEAAPPGPVVLMGSSLGGFVAWHVSARAEARARGPAEAGRHGEDPRSTVSQSRRNRIVRQVLLAPAFDFGANRLRDLGDDGMRRWRETGWHTFFHYAYGEPRAVHYGLYEDAQRFRASPTQVSVPTLIFQGTRDESVDPDMVIAFASSRPNIVLRLMDDGHQLIEQLERMWTETASFIRLTE
jgi:pimeloyl-ACP methyl ester carboxylesterase